MADRPTRPPLMSEERVIADNFDGDARLYAASRALNLQQLTAELTAGDTALAQADRNGLRRVAHVMKSVLMLIGQMALAQQAHALETSAVEAALATWAFDWAQLRTGIRAIA